MTLSALDYAVIFKTTVHGDLTYSNTWYYQMEAGTTGYGATDIMNAFIVDVLGATAQIMSSVGEYVEVVCRNLVDPSDWNYAPISIVGSAGSAASFDFVVAYFRLLQSEYNKKPGRRIIGPVSEADTSGNEVNGLAKNRYSNAQDALGSPLVLGSFEVLPAIGRNILVGGTYTLDSLSPAYGCDFRYFSTLNSRKRRANQSLA